MGYVQYFVVIKTSEFQKYLPRSSHENDIIVVNGTAWNRRLHYLNQWCLVVEIYFVSPQRTNAYVFRIHMFRQTN